MTPFGDAQLAQLQQMVSKIAADQAASDQAGAAYDQAVVAAATANAAVGAAQAAHAQTSGAVSDDLAALQAFVDALAAPPVPPAG